MIVDYKHLLTDQGTKISMKKTADPAQGMRHSNAMKNVIYSMNTCLFQE